MKIERGDGRQRTDGAATRSGKSESGVRGENERTKNGYDGAIAGRGDARERGGVYLMESESGGYDGYGSRGTEIYDLGKGVRRGNG